MVGQSVLYVLYGLASLYAILSVISLVLFLRMIDFRMRTIDFREGLGAFLAESWGTRALMLFSVFVLVPVFGPIVLINDGLRWLVSLIESPRHAPPAA